MTIIVEREALLRVLSREPSGTFPSITCEDTCIRSDGEYVLVDIPKRLSSVEKSQVGPTSDDQSTCSLSTDSLSSGSCHSLERRVTFAETLVSDEWTRPRTPRDQVSSLFYSTEETQRFRQEYRLERKVLSELLLDADCNKLDSEDVSKLIDASSNCQSGRHSISRVVVMHNDKLETFCNPKEEIPLTGDFFDNDSFW
eukprot:CAMPEP_0113626020 /NCGR_PEP_ID=MMETSP0017_2-20120614/13451_1 /TAXON_ID=2856 /ORGANISM="Cylindrotheca closterium" /LENGTH=197 /DNA_ID=CAMNT_0000536175 /DNA_START=16 /DNA_END=606 /DNA_ORIENTATION=+ /assembly_acc=CAM_ASM_000147